MTVRGRSRKSVHQFVQLCWVMFLLIFFFIFDSRIWPYYSRNVTRSISHYTLLSFWTSYITAHLENVWRDSLKDCSQNRMRNREKSALQRETHKHKIEKFFLDVNSDVFDIMCWWTHTKVCGGLDFYRRPVRMVCYTFYHRVWWLCSHVEFAEGKGKLSEWALVSSLLAIFAKSGGSLSSFRSTKFTRWSARRVPISPYGLLQKCQEQKEDLSRSPRRIDP